MDGKFKNEQLFDLYSKCEMMFFFILFAAEFVKVAALQPKSDFSVDYEFF